MKLYLYLARRDKDAVNVLSVFAASKPVEAARLDSVTRLGLPPEETAGLDRLVRENRMDWEPWVESAENYADLRRSLERRGYRNLPPACKPTHASYSYTDPYQVSLPTQKKPTMLRRATP